MDSTLLKQLESIFPNISREEVLLVSKIVTGLIKDQSLTPNLLQNSINRSNKEELKKSLHLLEYKEVLGIIKDATTIINTASEVIAEQIELEQIPKTKIPKLKNIQSFHVKWKCNLELLRLFYSLLIEYKFINISFKKFKIHFILNAQTDEIIPLEDSPIQWLQAKNELVAIFNGLDGIATNLLYEKHLQLSVNFLDYKNRHLDPGVLRTLLNKNVRRKDRRKVVELILDKMVNAVDDYKLKLQK